MLVTEVWERVHEIAGTTQNFKTGTSVPENNDVENE
jgi:hypothetical protein